LKLRVGALPQYPSNALNYNLTWSTDGVINEYCEPCEAVVNGERVLVPAMEEREEFSLDGVTYEAFNTSGGLGTLCDTLAGKVRTLNYRTIRYPGHCAIMKALLQDLRLSERRDVLKDIFENALPSTLQDVVRDLRHRQRPDERPADPADLCQQGLQRRDRRRDA
jgi:saccharopine dehydrogenase-like NADP-dependent oxidoreductase